MLLFIITVFSLSFSSFHGQDHQTKGSTLHLIEQKNTNPAKVLSSFYYSNSSSQLKSIYFQPYETISPACISETASLTLANCSFLSNWTPLQCSGRITFYNFDVLTLHIRSSLVFPLSLISDVFKPSSISIRFLSSQLRDFAISAQSSPKAQFPTGIQTVKHCIFRNLTVLPNRNAFSPLITHSSTLDSTEIEDTTAGIADVFTTGALHTYARVSTFRNVTFNRVTEPLSLMSSFSPNADVSLTSEEFQTHQTVTAGNDSSTCSIHNCRFINIATQYTQSLQTVGGGGLTITRSGSSTSVEIMHCSFINTSSTAEEYSFGGAIYSDASMVILSTEFINCTSTSSYYAYGGAIYSSESSTFTSLTFTSCKSICE